jgi:iron complex outermembrane receptor protein
MTNKSKQAITRSMIALAVASAFPLHAAMAQEAKAEEAQAQQKGQLETVIVTAQRRSENIKDVPMAITTMKGERLDVLTAGGQDIRFLSGRSPSLTVESDYGRSFPRFYIRGQGNTDFDLNASQPVGLVVDDIVQENPILKGFPIFDVDQVEVLRGPQGTLFGRNSPAGVVKVDSAKPVFKTEGYANIGFGSHSAKNAEGAFNTAVSDTVAVRLSLQSQNRGNFVGNSWTASTGTKEFEGYGDHAARFQVLVKPSKDFSALFNVHARDMNGDATLFRANTLKPGTNELRPEFKFSDFPSDGINYQKLKTRGAVARLRWDLDGLSLHSITGYETVSKFNSRADVDGGYGAVYAPPTGPFVGLPFALETEDLLPDHSQLTQEFRVESSNKGPLQWIAGLFYFNEEIQIDSIAYNPLSPTHDLLNSFARQNQESKSLAAFGSINYTVSDKFKVRAGARYTTDKKDFSARRIEGSTTYGPHLIKTDTNNFSWDLAGTYELDKDTNLFSRLATGYRAPSMQGRLYGPTDVPTQAKAEKVTSFEVGVKQDMFNKRARLSASVFTYTVKDKQLTGGSGTTNQNVLLSADKAIGRGAEIDFQAILTDELRLTMGGSYNDTEIRDGDLLVFGCGSPCTMLNKQSAFPNRYFINGNPLPRSPKWQGNFTLRYSRPLGDGELYAYTDWSYRAKQSTFVYSSVEYTAKALTQGGLRVGYKWDNYEVAAFARNITDKVQVVGGIDINNLVGLVNEPRSFGVQLKANF